MLKKLLTITLTILLISTQTFAEYVENPDFKEFHTNWNGNSTSENPWKSREFLWDKNYARAEYDENAQVLKVMYGVFFTNTPNEEYSIDMIVWNDLAICHQTMNYKSFYMKGECTLDVKDDDINWAYKLKNIILDQDWNILHKELLEAKVAGYENNFSWKNISINVFERDEWNTMNISGGFYHDISELYEGHRIRFYKKDAVYWNMKLQWDNLDLYYNTWSIGLEFDATLKNVNPEGEESFYYEILDNNSNAIGSWIFKYDFTKNEDSINWKKLEWDAYYDTDKNHLLIKAYVDWVLSKPYEQYTISIATKGWGVRYSWEILFDEENKQVYSIIEFRWKDKKYSFEYQIQNESYRVIEEGIFKIEVDYKKKWFTEHVIKEQNNTSLETEEHKEEKSLSKVEVAINNFVEKQREKYSDDNELIEKLQKTQKVLELYAEKNTKYSSLVTEINSILQQKIDELK